MTRTDTGASEQAGQSPQHDCRPRAAKDSDDSQQGRQPTGTRVSPHPQHDRTGNLKSLPALTAEAPASRRQRQPARSDQLPANDSDTLHGDTPRALGPPTAGHRPVPLLRPSGAGGTSGGPADPVKTGGDSSPGPGGKGRRSRRNLRCTPVQSRSGLGAGRCLREFRGGHPGRPESQNI